jgi:hypothetical protein
MTVVKKSGSRPVRWASALQRQVLLIHESSDPLADFFSFHEIDLLHFFDATDRWLKPVGCFFEFEYDNLSLRPQKSNPFL